MNSLRFARLAARRARQAGNRFVYARDPLVSIVAALSGLDVIHEDHAPPLGSLQRLLRRRLYQTRRLRRIVLISEALRGLLQAQGLLAADDPRLCVAPDAAALHQVLPRGAERPAAMRVGYVGGFLPGRGIELVLDIARALPAHDFLLVGGTRTDLPAQGAGLPDNVRCAGYLPPARLAEAYCQVDILLMPYQPDTATRGGVASAAWMSPLKLFEYLASGAAVLSSDLPVLREVLHDGENALLLPPVDRAAWISAIEDLAADPARRRALGCAGQASIRNRHNWPARAASILRGLPGAHA